jgi:hypothetical protein
MESIREIALLVGRASDDSVLVGGQSVLFWAEIYGLVSRDDIPALTEDVDFVAGLTDIIDAENALSAKYKVDLRIANMDDVSANSGKMTVHHPVSGKINIDFLRMITGLDSGDLILSAISLSIDGVQFKIISPINLLKSKISNIGAHPGKRSEEGVEQARMAIKIAEKYLIEKVAAQIKPPYSDFEKIIAFSKCDAALYANKFYGLDTMKAIPLDVLPKDDPFLLKRYDTAMTQLVIKRDKFDALIQRMESFDKKPKSSRFQP